jgi:hypothetical protein
MRRYWVPLIMSDSAPEQVDMRKTAALTGIKLVFLNNAEPIKLIVYISPFIAAATLFYSLYVTAEVQRKEADAPLFWAWR